MLNIQQHEFYHIILIKKNTATKTAPCCHILQLLQDVISNENATASSILLSNLSDIISVDIPT